ncbi:hypothetical protein [Sulfitobacter sp. R18_1]|uniref:hypothetical protein n=1 Tax=Sulfitobacter sp. R18_1 TaxID=2821104 RepID=UPI001ADCD1B9|nr:hypothetical protein [Sulfitobacter sp. R18_1]MBO9428595.1 hypothetical protein [Sulfitobacter sp. R18_1]
MQKLVKFSKKYSFTALFIAMVSVCAFYLFVMAADRFISESRFTIKSQSEGAASGLDLGILGGTSASKQDQLVIRDYLKSHDMMVKVVEEFGLDILSAPSKDILWHINADTEIKRLLAHYRALVDFTYDEEASVSTLITQGFDPETSRKLNNYLLDAAENYINEFTKKTSASFITYAQQDVDEAYQEVTEVMNRIRDAQEKNAMVDPENDIKVVTSSISALENQLIEEKSVLSSLLTTFQEGTHKVQAQRKVIQNIETQLSETRSRMAGSGPENTDLAAASVNFSRLNSELEFAQGKYASSMKTLEAAKVQAMHSRKHLMIIDHPDVPDYAEYPKRLIALAFCIVVILVFMVLAKSAMRILKDY